MGVRLWCGRSAAIRRMLVAALVCVAMVLFVPASASAGTLDQQQASWGGLLEFEGSSWDAQVFTPALDGQLDQIDLLLLAEGNPSHLPADLTVQIWSVVGGVPSSPIPGASATVSFSLANVNTQAWVQVPISAPSVAGTQYAIVVASPTSSFPCDEACLSWFFDSFDPYPGGAAYRSLNSGSSWIAFGSGDFAFKTYVLTLSDRLAALKAAVDADAPSLSKQVKKIRGYAVANDTANACSELKSFLKNLNALAGNKKISAASAATIVDLAKAIQKTLGC